MRIEVRDALEAVCASDDPAANRVGMHDVETRRRGVSFDRLKGLLLNIVRELPEDMSVRELREELEGS